MLSEKLSNEETTSPESQESSIDIVEILSALWNSRKLIAYVVGISTALAIVVSLLLPEYFRSTTVLLPETDKSKLSAMGGLSDLASLAGVNTGDVSLVKLYPTIITSEAVLKNVIYAQSDLSKIKTPESGTLLLEDNKNIPQTGATYVIQGYEHFFTNSSTNQ